MRETGTLMTFSSSYWLKRWELLLIVAEECPRVWRSAGLLWAWSSVTWHWTWVWRPGNINLTLSACAETNMEIDFDFIKVYFDFWIYWQFWPSEAVYGKLKNISVFSICGSSWATLVRLRQRFLFSLSLLVTSFSRLSNILDSKLCLSILSKLFKLKFYFSNRFNFFYLNLFSALWIQLMPLHFDVKNGLFDEENEN